MPLAASTSWLTVPEGLTQVIAAECSMPSRSAHLQLVSTACCLRSANSSGKLSLVLFDRILLSIIPVKDTPSSLSSSVLRVHCRLNPLMSVKQDCMVPKIVAISTFLCNILGVSSALTTTSDRLQNCLGRRIISQQGFVP